MANFTPQQIEDFLQEFFDVVGTRQYTGARYVPIFGRAGSDTVEWDDLAPYEPLTVVMHQGVSYVSRRYVPTGIQITDTAYWVETYRFNAQVEAYRQEVLSFQGQIDEIRDDYVPFPDEATLPKYGTQGQVLGTLGDGGTQWVDPVVPSDEQAEEVITTWLAEHPEATTTVQDNSLTTAKYQDGSVTADKLAANSVTNAKLAANSVTNDKVADAAIGDANLMTNGVFNALNELYGTVGAQQSVTLEQGSISSGTGAPNTSTKHVRSSDFIVANPDFIIYVSTKFEISVYWYNVSNNRFISTTTFVATNGIRIGDIIVNDAVYFKVVLRLPNAASDMTPSDVGANEFGIFESLTPSENESRLLDAVESAVMTGEELTLEQGTLSGSNGNPSASTTRVRPPDFIELTNTLTILRVGQGVIVNPYWYDSNQAFISSTNFVVGDIDILSLAPANAKYMKFVVAKYNNSANITPQDAEGKVVLYTDKVTELQNELSSIETETPFSRKINVCEILKKDNVSAGNTGCCFVEHGGVTEFWSFMVSPDDHSESTRWWRTTFDPANLDFSGSEIVTLQHNLGHVNSCSYNKTYDAFVCGNGSSDRELSGELIIVEDAFAKTELVYNQALRIAFSDYGAKVNAIWGDSNNGRDDILFVVTNDGYDIYRVMLGRDTNALESGTYQKPTGFNGTYKILQHWEFGDVEEDLDNVVQGFCYNRHSLYYGYGHNTNVLPIHKIDLMQEIETLEVDYPIYDATGNRIVISIAGLTNYNDYLVLTYSNTAYFVRVDAL